MLIFNADDFCMSAECSQGIARAHLEGVVTSTSISVVGSLAEVEMLARLPRLSRGLHVNLSEGRSLLSGQTFPPALEQLAQLGEAEAYGEISAQLALYREVVGQDPGHMDSHQYLTYLSPSVFTAFVRVASQQGIPIRSPRPFLDPVRLRSFVQRVKLLRGVSLPFEVEERAARLGWIEQTYAPRWRSDEVLIDLDFQLDGLEGLAQRLQGASLEVVCHPRLDGEELQVLLQLRRLRQNS